MKYLLIICLLFANITAYASDNHMHNNESSVIQKETYSCPMHPQITSHKEGDCPICGMDLVLKEKSQLDKVTENIYSCPMHPQITSHKESECPICGMDLVLKKDTQSNFNKNKSSIKIQNFNAPTYKVEKQSINPNIKTFGVIKYNEKYIKHYHSRFEGWIESVPNLKNGDYINKGDLLYTVYSKEVVEAQNDFLIALNTGTKKENAKQRLIILGIHNSVIDSIEKNKSIIYQIPVYSKYEGIINDLKITEGMFINQQTNLFSLVNPNKLWIEGFLFENDYIWADLGNKIHIEIDYLKSNIESEINYVYPNVNSINKGIKFRGEIDNIKQYIKEGMTVDINIYSDYSLNGLFIPYSSLIQSEKNNQIIVKENNNYIIKNVTTGYYDKKQNLILIEEGIEEFEEIVISGQFLIDAEANIQGIKITGDSYE